VRALVLICLVAACDAGEKKPAPPPVKSTNVVTTITGPDLSYLPADSDIVVQVDFKMLRESKLWPTYEADVAKLLVPGFAGCEYKPLATATSAVIGVPIKAKLGVFVIRGVDRDKALTCLHTRAAGPWVARFDRGVVTLTRTNAVEVLTFIDATTMVMQYSSTATKDALAEALQGGAPLNHDATFAVALKRLPPKAAVTVASRPGSKDADAEWAKLGVHLQYFFGSMDVRAGLAMQFAMELRTPDEATQLTKMMQAQFASAQVKAMFDRIAATAQGNTATLDIEMGETKLATLVTMVRALMPMD
jgi:phosphoribosylformylglycinamidine (FGAM) synthase PurS component